MSKVTRNLSTEESREWWATAEEASKVVRTWPDWKRAGINVSNRRTPMSERIGGRTVGELERLVRGWMWAPGGEPYERCDEMLRDLIAAAKAEERERCAKVCEKYAEEHEGDGDDYYENGPRAAEECADLIRELDHDR